MKIIITKSHDGFQVAPSDGIGTYKIGTGRTLTEALGAFTRAYQKELGLEIELSPESMKVELRRRKRELKKR